MNRVRCVAVQSSEKLTLGLEYRLGRENCKLLLATLPPNLARVSRLECSGELAYGLTDTIPPKALGACCSAIVAKAMGTRKSDRAEVAVRASSVARMAADAKLPS